MAEIVDSSAAPETAPETDLSLNDSDDGCFLAVMSSGAEGAALSPRLSNGRYKIVNKNGHDVCTEENNGRPPSHPAAVQLYRAGMRPSHEWQLQYNPPEQSWYIKSVFTNQFLTGRGGDAQCVTNNIGPAAHWFITQSSASGYWNIGLKNNNQLHLDNRGMGTNDGNPIITYGKNNSDAQRWALNRLGP